MACSADEEYLNMGYAVVAIVLILGGLIVHSFIVALNLTDSIKGKLITATDQIITSLGISRFIFHSTSFWFIWEALGFHRAPVMLSTTICFMEWLSAYYNVWLSVLLSAFLCLKISNFHNVFFVRLRMVMSQKVVHVIVLSLLLCLGYTSLMFTVTHNWIPDNSTAASTLNHKIRMGEYVMFLGFLWDITCFLIYSLSSVLVVVSLCLHMKRMKTERGMAYKIDTYVKTLTFIIVSFLVFLTFVMLSLFGDTLLSKFGFLELEIIWNVFNLFHSLSIICATVKLRNQLLRILRHTKCRSSESGDPVQMIT